MELADKMSFPSMAVTVDVNVVFFNSIAIKKNKKKKKKLKCVIFGIQWFRVEWKPSRQLVCPSEDSLEMSVTISLLPTIAATRS